MIFLMMAAHDTTTSTLTSMTYELARHSEWQERVREEAFALGKPWLDFEDVERQTTLTLVMKETLRRYPPLPVIPRIAERAFEFEGRRVPAGAMVVVAPIHTHHMPEWFPAPELFDPERFGPERAEHERHTHAWIPFGGGPPPLPGTALRGDADQVGDAPTRAALSLPRRARLPHAGAAGADLEAARRAARSASSASPSPDPQEPLAPHAGRRRGMGCGSWLAPSACPLDLRTRVRRSTRPCAPGLLRSTSPPPIPRRLLLAERMSGRG